MVRRYSFLGRHARLPLRLTPTRRLALGLLEEGAGVACVLPGRWSGLAGSFAKVLGNRVLWCQGRRVLTCALRRLVLLWRLWMLHLISSSVQRIAALDGRVAVVHPVRPAALFALHFLGFASDIGLRRTARLCACAFCVITYSLCGAICPEMFVRWAATR
jgi:hypothetical protein